MPLIMAIHLCEQKKVTYFDQKQKNHNDQCQVIFSNAKWFIHHLIPALEDVKVIENW